ncbi:hypothetical protein ABPG75_003279 [Micractinium tetrahymenae]
MEYDPLGALSLSRGEPEEAQQAPSLQSDEGDTGGSGAFSPAAAADRRPQQQTIQQRQQAHPLAEQRQQPPGAQLQRAPQQVPRQSSGSGAGSLLAAAKAAAAAAAATAAAAASSAASTAAAVAAQLPSLPAVAAPRAAGALAPLARSPTAAATAAAPPPQEPPQQQQQQPLSPSSRSAAFRRVLSGEPAVNMTALCALAFEGIPDEPRERGLRAAVWRLLLGLLPPERTQWERALRSKRAEYEQFCEELIVDPKQLGSTPAGLEAAPGSHPNPLVSHASSSSTASLAPGSDGPGAGSEAPAGSNGAAAEAAAGASPTAAAAAAAQELARLALSGDDHPLSTSGSSRWKAYFQDVEVQEQIERDVARTHPDMHFFSGEGGAAATHRAQMRRALFIFAKLNPGLRYVQGMNELYAPLYYLFRTDPNPEAAQHAEADAFFCFCDLMGEFRDHFCQQLDNSTVGIRATLGRLSQMLRCQDEELWEHLERGVRINPQFYAFRWITLALTQEFPFPDALRLWDSLLSDPAGRSDCLLRLCTAMLLHVRQELLTGDFATCMKLLQRYPPVDVHVILARAEALKRTRTVIVLSD